VLLSLVYRLVRCLFGLLAVLARSDLSKDAELLVLRHENQVLRRQLVGRLRWDHAGRLWLAALSRLVSRRRWAEVFPVTPATILRSLMDLARPGLRGRQSSYCSQSAVTYVLRGAVAVSGAGRPELSGSVTGFTDAPQVPPVTAMLRSTLW